MKPVILIVDDSRAMRRIQRDVVQELGEVEVIEACDGLDAARKLSARDYRVDLILLDWVMPNLDGLGFAKKIKAHKELRKIPVLMVTSISEERKIREAWRTGVDGYLLKPFTKEMLLRAILSVAPDQPDPELQRAVDVAAMPDDKLPLLDELGPDTHVRLLDATTFPPPGADGMVLRQGEEVEHFWYVLEGTVERVEAGVGAEGILRFGRGDAFATSELISHGRAAASYRTTAGTRVGAVPRAAFEALLLQSPDMSVALSRHLAHALRERKLPRPASVPPTGEGNGRDTLSGTTAVLELPDLIQALTLRQSTGIIELDDVEGRIEIFAGQVVRVTHPDCPEEAGEDAFLRVMQEQPEKFRFVIGATSRKRNVKVSTTQLMLDCMRRLDEMGIEI